MTRLGHALTTLTTALTLAVTGSAFAQSVSVSPVVVTPVTVSQVEVPQVVPPVVVPRVEIPRIYIPRIDTPIVQVPHIEIPRIDIPQIEIQPQDFDFDFHFDHDFQFDHDFNFDFNHDFNFNFDNFKFDDFKFDHPELLDQARSLRDLVEVGKFAQKFDYDSDKAEKAREKAEDMKERAKEMAKSQKDMAVAMRDKFEKIDRFEFQGPKPRTWDGCNERNTDRLYDCGREALDDKQWDRAVEFFGRVAATKTERSDAALYWKAYAQNKLGQRSEALATIAEFKSAYAKSKWGNEVSALEIDVRQHSGQPVKPGETTDDELKLYALQALMNNNSPEVVPQLEKLLTGPQSPRVKDRALFVLAQTQTPAARAIVVKIAKGGANPELQARAVRYLGEMNTPEARQTLSEVYTSTTDVEMKRNILRSYMVSRDREHLVAAARGEQDPSLRGEAIRQLGNMRADDALGELYAREQNGEVKKQIIRSLGNSGNADMLLNLAQTEQNGELRRQAIRTLGNLRRTETGPRLIDMYQKEQNVDVRKAVIDALFIQNNATALVQLARKEANNDLKLELVKKLGNMKDKEAQDYLIELLK